MRFGSNCIQPAGRSGRYVSAILAVICRRPGELGVHARLAVGALSVYYTARHFRAALMITSAPRTTPNLPSASDHSTHSLSILCERRRPSTPAGIVISEMTVCRRRRRDLQSVRRCTAHSMISGFQIGVRGPKGVRDGFPRGPREDSEK